MSENQEAARLRECLRYIRSALRNNSRSTHEICETINRAIGHDVIVAHPREVAPTSSGGGGGGSTEGMMPDPTTPAGTGQYVGGYSHPDGERGAIYRYADGREFEHPHPPWSNF
jgi:hypothetical protein